MFVSKSIWRRRLLTFQTCSRHFFSVAAFFVQYREFFRHFTFERNSSRRSLSLWTLFTAGCAQEAGKKWLIHFFPRSFTPSLTFLSSVGRSVGMHRIYFIQLFVKVFLRFFFSVRLYCLSLVFCHRWHVYVNIVQQNNIRYVWHFKRLHEYTEIRID